MDAAFSCVAFSYTWIQRECMFDNLSQIDHLSLSDQSCSCRLASDVGVDADRTVLQEPGEDDFDEKEKEFKEGEQLRMFGDDSGNYDDYHAGDDEEGG